jgi:hypothetical protein
MQRLISNFCACCCSLALAAALTVFDTQSAAGQQTFELNEQTFNQWLYNASQGQFDSESELALMLESVDRVCGLSAPQKEKLLLAGRGDYARFERQVDELRAEYVGKTYDQNKVGEIYNKIQPLGMSYQAGLLGESSLFAKVLTQTLTPEQAKDFEQLEAERQQTRYAAKVRLYVAALERSCPLTDKQRTALIELLIGETKAPKRFGQYDWYVILYQAGKVPDEKYEQIIDAAQMRHLKNTLRQGQGMEHFLRQQELLADD